MSKEALPPAGAQDEWALIEQSFIEARVKENGGRPLSPTEHAQIKNSILIAKERYGASGDQATALRKLFTSRPDLALATAKNIIDLGKKAGETEIGLQDKAQTGAISLSQLAGATDIEVQGIEAKFYAGWAGPITFLGKLLNRCGMSQWGNACIDFANDLRAAPINEKYAVNRLYQQKERVGIDENKAVNSQILVWDKALGWTTKEIAGVTKEEGTKLQEDLAEVREQNSKGRPYYEAPPPSGSSAGASGQSSAAPATSAAVNIGDIAKKIVEQGKKDGITVSDAKAIAQARAVNSADKGGNNNGSIDTETEAKRLGDSPAVKSLDDAQRATLWKSIGMTPTGEIVKPGVAGPSVSAPAPTPVN